MPESFDKIFENAEKQLDKIIEKTEKQIHFGMQKIGKDILNESAGLVKGGKIQGGLKDAQALQEKVQVSAAGALQKIETNISTALGDIESLVKSEFEATGLKYDKTSMDVLQRQIESGFQAVASESMAQVGQLFYDAVLTGMKYDSFVDSFQKILSDTDPDFFIRNAEMNFYQQVHLEKAAKAGLTDFLYYGNVMATTRAWCIVRVGKVFTKKEIDSWAGDSWKGKSCHPMICRGGYNCRHHWRPVKKSWLADGEIKPQSIFDERPEEMTDGLKADIRKEAKALGGSALSELVAGGVV